MSEIDTSAAAIERIKALQEQYRPLFEPDDARVAYEFFQNVDTLLAALAERDAKLAAHDACLTQVREEMPEVEKALRDFAYSDSYDRQGCELIQKVRRAIDTLQQSEARWRNSRDEWEAERKRQAEVIDLLEQQVEQRNSDLRLLSDSRDKHGEFIEGLKRQLSASNAACAVMREALDRTSSTVTNLCDRLDRINRICWDTATTGPSKLAAVKEWSAGFMPEPSDPNALAAQPKQQEQP